MKVKALINYYDKKLKRNIVAGEIYNVESEERVIELLGENEKGIVCCEIIKEAEIEETGAKANETNEEKEAENKNAKRK